MQLAYPLQYGRSQEKNQTIQLIRLREQMSNAKKVLAVFALLTNSLPNSSYCQAELLEDSNSLVELFDPPSNEPQFSLRIGGRPMSEWAADIAMNHQPWSLVCQERSVKEYFEIEDECYAESFEKAKYLMVYGV